MHVYVAVLQPCTEGMIKNLTWSWRNVQRLCQLDSSLQIQPSSLVHSQQGGTLHSHPKDIIHQDSAVPLPANVSGLHVVSKAVPYTVMPKILYTKTVQSLLQPTSVVHSQQGHTLHSHVKDIIHQDSAVCLTATWSPVSKAVP